VKEHIYKILPPPEKGRCWLYNSLQMQARIPYYFLCIGGFSEEHQRLPFSVCIDNILCSSVRPGPWHREDGALSPSVTGGGGGTPLHIGKQDVGTYSCLYGEK
jgi:hypothetical protein